MATHESYTWLIDELVEIAKMEVSAQRIRARGHPVRDNETDEFPLAPSERAAKELLLSLKTDQREIIARMLENARQSAIHDVAGFLEENIATGQISIAVQGNEISESPFASMVLDFICRYEGDSWPEQA